jgi:MFS family permease
MKATSPFAIKNIRRFIAFRIFFNSRFYYPIFTILFLDYGLSIEQFALLNTVWAITIVCCEVPSGALADLLGRKRLLVLTSALMILELSVIAFVPISSINVVFWAFFINRILSGLAEAMASGADEAIAYDSLVQDGNPGDWPKVLSLQMRLKALAGIISMTVGAMLYDPDVVNTLLAFFGMSITVSQEVSMRFPVYLTLVLGFFSLWATLGMREVSEERDSDPQPISMTTVWQAGRVTWQAGLWIMATPFAMAVILFGMMYDHVLRMIITLTSQYFRLILLPEASFGLIMAMLSILGLLIPRVAEYMVAKFSPQQNCLWLGLITFLALWGLTGFVPYLGIFPMALVTIGLMLTAFFTSHYLNLIASSEQRATVLSFKGLAFNLGYGLIGILFALLMQFQRTAVHAANPELITELIENEAFRATINWFPWYDILLTALTVFYALYLLRNTGIHRKKP